MQVASHPFFNVPTWPIITKFISVNISRPFDSQLLRWEWMALLLCVLIFTHTFIVPENWFLAARIRFKKFAADQRRAVWACGLFPVLTRVLLLPLAPINPPSVHDEFSLLLLGDTLRSGRLTNKAHLFWQHFETIHVIQQPTYSSMYPPGSGLFPAIGILLGDPWVGILLSIGIMCGALCWALQAWLSPSWALLVALLAALQIGIGSYWINGLVGAPTAPAIAGCLLLGAVPRFLRRPAKGTAAIFAVAVVLLVNTRPYEGSILSIFLFVAAVWWRRTAAFGNQPIYWKLLAPAACIILFGALFTLYDSWRVTGHPFKIAYQVNRETYGWPENLAYIPPEKITFRHPNLQNMYNAEVWHRTRYSTFGRIIDSCFSRWALLWQFYVGPGLTIALLFLPWSLRNSKIRPILYIVGLALGINTLQLVAFPQHVSPYMALFYLLLAAGLQQFYSVLRSNRLPAERMFIALAFCLACGAAFSLFIEPLGIKPSLFWDWPHFGYFRQRAAVVSKLESFPGKHLMLVRYAPTHFPHEEWVYNAANIDRSRIVWANAMDAASDNKLRQYFQDRQAWIIEPDRDPTSFLPLTESTYR